MKTASFFLCAAALVLASTSCGKHSWAETQGLHEKYQHHAEAAHGDAHAPKDAHAKEAEHGEKKAH
jgi:hypothetical protein